MGRISKNYTSKSTTSEPNHGWDRSPVWRKGKYLQWWQGQAGRACPLSYLPHLSLLYPLTSKLSHWAFQHQCAVASGSGLLSSVSLYNPVDGTPFHRKHFTTIWSCSWPQQLLYSALVLMGSRSLLIPQIKRCVPLKMTKKQLKIKGHQGVITQSRSRRKATVGWRTSGGNTAPA